MGRVNQGAPIEWNWSLPPKLKFSTDKMIVHKYFKILEEYVLAQLFRILESQNH